MIIKTRAERLSVWHPWGKGGERGAGSAVWSREAAAWQSWAVV